MENLSSNELFKGLSLLYSMSIISIKAFSGNMKLFDAEKFTSSKESCSCLCD